MSNPYRSIEQFRREVLTDVSGPMTSPVEDIADELFHNSIQNEFDSMWDSVDSDEE